MASYFSPMKVVKDQRISLTNEYNVYYYGTLQIGTPFQAMGKIMFDNAYGYNLLEYNGCTSGCVSTLFQSGSSSTYKELTNANPLPSGLKYVQRSSDRFCLA